MDLPRTVADGCERLRTVADGSATSSEHTLNPQTPRVKREPLLRIREKNMCRKITPETQAKKIMFPLFSWQHLATEMVNPRQLSFPTHQQAEAALRSR